MVRSITQTVTVPEAARAMKCSIKWIYDCVRAGKINAKKIGGQWRIPKKEIEARMERRNHRE